MITAAVCAGEVAGARADEPSPPVNHSPSAAVPTFYIGEYRISGNTLLTALQIEQVVGRFLGEGRTFADVEAAREQLELRYRDAGYATVIVNIPEQDVVDGVVTLEVVEGKVETLRVVGSRYFSLERVRRQVPALAEGAVPFMPDAQAQLSALNARSADRAVTPVLRPSRTPGTLEVELRVADELPLHGDIELNNRYSADTTKLRANASVRYDNLWQREHSLSLQYQTSPQDTEEVKVLSGTYLARFTGTDDLLVAYGVKSDSETASVGDLNVIGKGRIGGLRGIKPFPAQSNYFHSVSAGFDYKDFDEAVELQGADTLKTPIDYLNWSVQYSGTARQKDALARFALGPNFGIRGLANDAQEFDDKRYKAKPNYLYLRGNVDYTHSAWRASQFVVKVEGQVTASPLISNEQFSAGGAQSVRGYTESTALGDDAVAGSLEWRTPSFGGALGAGIDELIFLAFVDGAALRVRQPLPAQTARYDLYGAGVGLRLSAWKHLSAEADWAYPLKDEGSVEKGDDRWHFSVRYTF